jgi:hypothetical protein
MKTFMNSRRILMKNMIISLAFLVSFGALAADSSSGCGLGWEVAPKQSLVSSFTRNLVNATASSTIAMTLGTSGCAKHSIVQNDAKGIHFAEANLNQLAIDFSRGNGEFVNGFAAVFGCQNVNAFGSMVQSNYDSVMTNNVSGVELYNNVKKEIQKNAALSQSCTLI